jgi:hypothetical protein
MGRPPSPERARARELRATHAAALKEKQAAEKPFRDQRRRLATLASFAELSLARAQQRLIQHHRRPVYNRDFPHREAAALAEIEKAISAAEATLASRRADLAIFLQIHFEPEVHSAEPQR